MSLHGMLLAAGIFALTVHVILLIFFVAVGVPLFIIYNIFSSSFFVFVMGFFVRRKKYKAAGYLLTVEITVYTIVQLLVFSGRNYTEMYFFIVLLMQMIVPFSSRKECNFRIVLLWVAIVATFAASLFVEPLFSLGTAAPVLAVINLNVAFLAFVIELSIDNIINRIIDSLKTEEYNNLEKEANLDPLTGLFNRRYAKGYFSGFKTRHPEKGACVAMADIDDFKVTNDTYGHGVGDDVLRAIAQTMKKTLRRTDTLFRWGGEEFLLVLEDIDIREARRILEKLRKAVEETKIPVPEREPVRSTITIGVAALLPDNIEGSIEKCDKRMYQGKVNGKNQVV